MSDSQTPEFETDNGFLELIQPRDEKYIEELEEVRPVVSPVSTVTDNHTELRVYDVGGRYIPVKELDKLPAGAYIVNGKKVVVK